MIDEIKLFLGFSPDPLFEQHLQFANPYVLSLFIGKEEYLQEITHAQKRYLGKFLSPFPTLDQLEDTEKHLISLLQRLAPKYNFAHKPPELFAVNIHI
jgi:hypothetical protein